MKNLLIDNWNLEEIFSSISEMGSIELTDSYKDLLSAVVLWDKIFCPNNEMSIAWKRADSSLSRIVTPIDDIGHLFEEEATKICYDIADKHRYNDIVAKGAVRYQLLSNSLGLNYLPAPKRASFLKENNYLLNKMIRSKIHNIVDASVMSKFEELDRVLGDNVISFKMPLLVDYIIYNTNNGLSYLDCALQIKNTDRVKRYREYLSTIEQEISEGNWRKLYSFKSDVEELINDILKLDRKHIVTAGISIFPMPSINISFDLPIKKKPVHLTFIRELVNFAFNQRVGDLQ